MIQSIPWHLGLMAGLYILAGILHFVYPKTYVRILPSFIRPPRFFVYLSGAIEVILGIGVLFQSTQKISIYAIIGMLMVFLSVHFNMLNNQKSLLWSTAMGFAYPHTTTICFNVLGVFLFMTFLSFC